MMQINQEISSARLRRYVPINKKSQLQEITNTVALPVNDENSGAINNIPTPRNP